MQKRISVSGGVLCLVLSIWSPAAAQVSTGEIAGTVVDASGAAVPKAKVTATNAETGTAVRSMLSGPAGDYIMTLLPPGSYTMSVESPGFRKLVQSGVILQVNQRIRLDFTLQLGQVSETVEVKEAAPLLESQSSSVGSNIGQQLVDERKRCRARRWFRIW